MSLLSDLLEGLARASTSSGTIRTTDDLTLEHAPELLPAAQAMSRETMQQTADEMAQRGVSRHVITTFRALHYATAGIARAAGAGNFVVAELVWRNGQCLRGGLLNYHLGKWRARQLSDADTSALSFLRYVQDLINGPADDIPPGMLRVVAVLKAILGDTFDFTTQVVPRVVDRRPTLKLLRFLHPSSTAANVADGFARLARSDNALRQGVDGSFERVNAMIERFPSQAGYLAETFAAFNTPAGRDAVRALTEKLLLKYAPDGDLAQLTGEHLQKLARHDKVSAEHVLDEIVLSQIMVLRRLKEVEAMGGFGEAAGRVANTYVLDGVRKTALDMFDELLEVPGAEGFFETVLTRSPHEHAYVFEQLISFNLLDALLKQHGSAAGRLFIQVTIGSKSGPDNILALTLHGKTIGRSIQAKSVNELTALVRAVSGGASEAGERALGDAAGAIIEQARRDVERKLEAGGKVIDRATGALLNVDMFDGILRSKIDLERLRLDTNLFDSGFRQAFRQALEADDILTDTLTGRGFFNFVEDATEFAFETALNSRDPRVLTRLKQLVKSRLLDPALDAVKSEIAAVDSLIAEQVRKLNLAEFQARFEPPDPSKTEWTRIYNELIELFTEKSAADVSPARVAELEIAIRDKVIEYFNAMFLCKNISPDHAPGSPEDWLGGVLQLEFDLVDVLTDIDVSRGIISISD